MKKKVLILAAMQFNQQAAIEAALAGHSVQFMNSADALVGRCRSADIIAVGTNHEEHLPAFFENGFKGIIVPLLVDKKQGMTIKGKFEPAVPIRKLSDYITENFTKLKPIAA